MATILSLLGVDQITSSIPYLDQIIELLENILKLLLLVGSKAAYKVSDEKGLPRAELHAAPRVTKIDLPNIFFMQIIAKPGRCLFKQRV